MFRTIVMDECITAIKRRNDRYSPECFVEPASAEMFLTHWKIPQNTDTHCYSDVRYLIKVVYTE